MNEHVVGQGWPGKAERNDRLLAGTQIIRALMRDEEVDEAHRWFSVDKARLWSEIAPSIYAAALTPETAQWSGTWANGLVTVRKPRADLEEMVARYRAGGGGGKPLALQLQISWALNEADARTAAWEQWRNAAAPSDCLAELKTPEEFDAVTTAVRPEEIDEVIPLITRADQLLDIIHQCASCGFDEIYIHNVSLDQHAFMGFVGRAVLPELRTVS
ncbi:G6PDH family F420-dependent oxidoreductase [Neorhizobium sp. 2083]|uniref:LLM class flavin-dependent oxidoreductase n=1 Tax=Neorhizobium sp. 2083 TaxID=2817762 RepID=UPI00285E94B6|nr:LLM class flavin-dependent oxidoreductase [Neorhizobium sp. 2083]MDR6820782.1 G6PDH family F420-dependent oxidoreductase [Neorhizobium sp. 2083]